MKIPKAIRRYCKHCKKHTDHKIHNQSFKGLSRTHTQSRWAKVRVRKRGLRRGVGNLGRFSKKAISKWKRTGAKSSKKTDLRFTCVECRKSSTQSHGIRLKKVEFV